MDDYRIGHDARGCDNITDNELRQERLYINWFQTNNFRDFLFLTWLTYVLLKRHFKLSLDIFPMSVCQVFAEFLFILVTHFRTIFAETETAESAPYLFFLYFTKAQNCVGNASAYK